MRLNHLVIIFIFAHLSLCCSSQKPSNETIEIYNLVIDDNVKPLPPPPPEPGDNSGMPKKVKDSLRKVKLNIAISNRLELYREQSFNFSSYENYQMAKEDLIANKNQSITEKYWLKTAKGHNISVIDIERMNKNKLFEKYNAIVSLSNIGFNPAKDKAIVIIGISYAPKLSGTVVLHLLDKINGKWQMSESKTLEFS